MRGLILFDIDGTLLRGGDPDHALAFLHAMREVYGREPIYVRSGGSVPITAVFQRVLGPDTVSFAFAQSGSNAHAPNEWFRVDDLALGRRGNCLYFEALGE